jgi:iron complex transport system substrate-binding protein
LHARHIDGGWFAAHLEGSAMTTQGMSPSRVIRYCVLIGALVGLAAWAQAATSAALISLTDDRGVVVHFTKSPQRIVSLLPSLTETVCELGQCQRLVGVDRYSNFPNSVRTLPQVGGGLDPSIEAIVALKPDVVLMASSSRGAERLRSLGLVVVELEPKTHADVRRVIEVLGVMLAVPEAQRLWREIDTAMSVAAASVPKSAKNAKVYFEVNSAPYAAGEASFIGETLTRLGVKNIVPASLGAFPKINPEFVVRANPDFIMVGDQNYAGMEGRPGWSSLRALKEHRVCIFSATESDSLVRPGPRMAEGARRMALCLQGRAT